MAETLKHMATCGCGSVGDVVDQSHRFEFKDPWWVIQHQGGAQHTNVRVKVGDRFKMVLKS